jgi:hypothetical protein
MQKYQSTLVTALILLCICLQACKQGKTQPSENGIKFDSVAVRLSPHFLDDPELPTFNIELDFTFPASGLDAERLSAVRKIFIRKILADDLGDLSPQEAAKARTDRDLAYIGSIGDEYREAMKRHGHEADSDDGDFDFLPDLAEIFTTVKNEILFNKNNILCSARSERSYFGGAHGSSRLECFNIDLASAQILAEPDIFTDGYEAPLGEIILAKLTEQNHLRNAKELEEQGYFSVDEIAPNGNFAIGDDGITYYFNEYEIAAYYVGLIPVFLPYEEIAELMRPDSPASVFLK